MPLFYLSNGLLKTTVFVITYFEHLNSPSVIEVNEKFPSCDARLYLEILQN